MAERASNAMVSALTASALGVMLAVWPSSVIPTAMAQPTPSASASASPPAPAPPALAELSFDGGNAAYYAPARDGAQRVTVYLHGMCASGRLECPVFAPAAQSDWLLCADGNTGCNGGGWMWAATPKATEARLTAAVDALRARHGARVGTGPQAIIGYSLGAPAALLQVMREPSRYDRLMIVNASVEPAAAAMKKAGVKRVALVAGARDATASKLQAAARRLAAAGVDARFFSLEATGHYFDNQSADRLATPLAWLLAN